MYFVVCTFLEYMEYKVSETYSMTTNVLAGLGDFHRSVSGNRGGDDIRDTQDTWKSEIQQTLINPLSSRHI